MLAFARCLSDKCADHACPRPRNPTFSPVFPHDTRRHEWSQITVFLHAFKGFRLASRKWGLWPKLVPPNIYETTWDALEAGDVERLEELTHLSSFPCGLDGWHGLHWLTTAIHTGNLTSVAWVLGRKPDVTYIEADGFTALKSALQMEMDCRLPPDEAAAFTIRLIDMLLDAGADINQRMTLDVTLLHVAAEGSSPAVVAHLLARGADPHAVSHDYTPRTPAGQAAFRKRWDVHAILRAARENTPEPPAAV